MRISEMRQLGYDDDAFDFDEIGRLRCQAYDLGIDNLDPRWGATRLRQEIEKMTKCIEISVGSFKGKIQQFEPKPDDVFVLTVPGEINEEHAKRFKSQWEEIFPSSKLVIVTGGITIGLQGSKS